RRPVGADVVQHEHQHVPVLGETCEHSVDDGPLSEADWAIRYFVQQRFEFCMSRIGRERGQVRAPQSHGVIAEHVLIRNAIVRSETNVELFMRSEDVSECTLQEIGDHCTFDAPAYREMPMSFWSQRLVQIPEPKLFSR